MNNATRLTLMKRLFSKMSLKLKLLDILASIGGTLSECFSICMYLFCAVAITDSLNQMAGYAPLTNLPSYIYGILAISFGVAKGGFRYLEQYLNHNIAFHMLAEIRHYVYEALERLAPAKLEDKKSGDMLSLMTADIETLEVFYAHTLSPMLIALLSFLIVFITSLSLGCYIPAAVYLVFFATIGILVPFISFKVIGRRGEEQRKQNADFSSYMLDSLDCTLPILMTGRQKETLDEIDRKSTALNKTICSIKWKNSLMTRTNQLLLSLANLIFVILALIELFNIKEGSYLYAMICVIVLPGSFRPALALGALPGSLSNTFASARRFLNLIDEEPEVKENTSSKNATKLNSLSIQSVSFAYPDDAERTILDNVSLSIPNKGIIGIQGPSGNGKSTLLKLILNHRKLNDGSISWNNTNINDINSVSLREKISFMEQDTYLFKETLRENMLEAKPDATDEEIKKALKDASIKNILDTLPEGLDTYIDNENLNISTGEKQRIGLARIILRDPELILLDEPTSNVDSYTEMLMLDTFKKLSKKKSILIVSHSSSTLAITDSIYTLKNGVISASTK